MTPWNEPSHPSHIKQNHIKREAFRGEMCSCIVEWWWWTFTYVSHQTASHQNRSIPSRDVFMYRWVMMMNFHIRVISDSLALKQKHSEKRCIHVSLSDDNELSHACHIRQLRIKTEAFRAEMCSRIVEWWWWTFTCVSHQTASYQNRSIPIRDGFMYRWVMIMNFHMRVTSDSFVSKQKHSD